MTTSAIGSSNTTPTAANLNSTQKSFRDVDFLKIILSEVTQQDPMNPQDTSKMVDGMQKLQELANTTYQKFHSDLNWAQTLLGKNVTVGQQSLTPQELEQAVNKGLNPDVGSGTKTGQITSYRSVDENVFVNIDGHDYPLDNMQQVVPVRQDPAVLSQVATNLLGFNVGYYRGDITDRGTGKVTGVNYGLDNNIMLTMDNGEQVRYDHMTSITGG